jgi:hypothetical protein
MKMTLSRFDPQPRAPEKPTAWTVGFDVSLDGGRTVHSVTTVYAANLPPDPDHDTVIAAARDELLPSLRLQNAGPEQAMTADGSPLLGREVEIPTAEHRHPSGEEHRH